MKREFLDYVEDMIDAMDRVTEFTEGMKYDDFAKDDKSASAVIRKLEIIGEAVKKIPEGVKKEYPEIPWKDMAGMRDKLIHGYFGVNLKKVWQTAKKDIPNLKSLFGKILEDWKNKEESLD